MGLKKNEKLGDELQFLSAKNALSRSGGFVTADGTRQIRKYTHTTTTTPLPPSPPLAQKNQNICC
jgi:hypothetical protein